MAKKLGPPIFLGVFTIIALVFLTGGGTTTDDKDILRDTFALEAIYYDTGHVEISYLDKSDKTTKVVLEVLGMDESFQKSFTDSEFIEIIPFAKESKYGWAVNPIVLEIDHIDFGHIQLKTEIHPLDSLVVPVVIYSRP